MLILHVGLLNLLSPDVFPGVKMDNIVGGRTPLSYYSAPRPISGLKGKWRRK